MTRNPGSPYKENGCTNQTFRVSDESIAKFSSCRLEEPQVRLVTNCGSVPMVAHFFLVVNKWGNHMVVRRIGLYFIEHIGIMMILLWKLNGGLLFSGAGGFY